MNFQCELTENCYVDKADLDILCDQWLHPGDCSADPHCADFNGDEIVNFKDLALMGQEWKI